MQNRRLVAALAQGAVLVIQAVAVESVNTAAAASDILSPRPDGLGVPGLQAEALTSIQSPRCVNHKPTACELGKDARSDVDWELLSIDVSLQLQSPPNLIIMPTGRVRPHGSFRQLAGALASLPAPCLNITRRLAAASLASPSPMILGTFPRLPRANHCHALLQVARCRSFTFSR